MCYIDCSGYLGKVSQPLVVLHIDILNARTERFSPVQGQSRLVSSATPTGATPITRLEVCATPNDAAPSTRL